MYITIDGTTVPDTGYFEDGADGHRVPSFTFEEFLDSTDEFFVGGLMATTRGFRRVPKDVWEALPAAEKAKFRRDMAIELLLEAAGAAAKELGMTVTITPTTE